MRVRFGEVEARGVALTPAGRDRYDRLVEEVDRRLADDGGSRQDVAAEVWRAGLPATEEELFARGLAFFESALDPAVAAGSMTEGQREAAESGDLAALVESGVVTLRPIVYEDFLPRSAAGIFASNLTDRGSMDAEQGGAERDAAWMSDVIGAQVHLPEQVYAEQAAASLAAVEQALGRPLR